jgi:uncharacterized protein (TIGR02145 family)
MKQLKNFLKVVILGSLGLILSTCQKDALTVQEGLLQDEILVQIASIPELTLDYPVEVSTGEEFNILFSSTCGKLSLEHGYINGAPILDASGAVIGYEKVYAGLTCETPGLLWEAISSNGFTACSGGTITENLNEDGTYVFRAKLNAKAVRNSGCPDCSFRGTHFECFMITASTLTGTMNDCDGNTYKWVKIGTQVWMAENLRTTRYCNGDSVGTTIPATLDIRSLGIQKYQWPYVGYENKIAEYGRLYTWYAVTDSRNVCPAGWHVPSDPEWQQLALYLTNNGYGYGGNMTWIGKSMADTTGWTTYTEVGTIGNNQASNNSTGFTARPSGVRNASGSFYGFGLCCYLWSSTEYSTNTSGISSYLWYNLKSGGNRGAASKLSGYSVRCLRN